MNPSNVAHAAEPPNSWHMVRALAGLGILCSVLVVLTFQMTLPVITKNKAEALQRAIFKVLPGARTRATLTLTPAGKLVGVEADAVGDWLVYAGYDDGGQLVGVAVPAEGNGFQDKIGLLYGYCPSREQIVGIEVLESRETPGLGDKIQKDESFLANFAALDVALAADGKAFLHPIEAVKHGSKEHRWQVDGITGATISSVAVTDIIRRSATRVLPSLILQVDQLKRKGP